jgi:hypothetical protein
MSATATRPPPFRRVGGRAGVRGGAGHPRYLLARGLLQFAARLDPEHVKPMSATLPGSRVKFRVIWSREEA